MKKYLFVNCSPRIAGNCDCAMNIASEQLQNMERFLLRTHWVKPCKACALCKNVQEPQCIQGDDMGALIPRLDSFDGFIFASPIYAGMVNASAKAFLDRTYPFFVEGALGPSSLAKKLDKKAIILLTAGAHPASRYADQAEIVANVFKFALGVSEARTMVLDGGDIPGAIFENPENVARWRENLTWLAQ